MLDDGMTRAASRLIARRTAAPASPRTRPALRAGPRSRASFRSSPSRAPGRASRGTSKRAIDRLERGRLRDRARPRDGRESTRPRRRPRSSRRGVTRFTRPHASASAAVSLRASRIISFARASPTIRGRRCVPPAPGMMPSDVSGSASSACAAATRMSQIERELETAAERDAVQRRDDRLGRSNRAARAPRDRARPARARRSSVMPCRSLRSAPAQNALSPAPGDHDRAHRAFVDRFARELAEARGASPAKARSCGLRDRSSRRRPHPDARREPANPSLRLALPLLRAASSRALRGLPLRLSARFAARPCRAASSFASARLEAACSLCSFSSSSRSASAARLLRVAPRSRSVSRIRRRTRGVEVDARAARAAPAARLGVAHLAERAHHVDAQDADRDRRGEPRASRGCDGRVASLGRLRMAARRRALGLPVAARAREVRQRRARRGGPRGRRWRRRGRRRPTLALEQVDERVEGGGLAGRPARAPPRPRRGSSRRGGRRLERAPAPPRIGSARARRPPRDAPSGGPCAGRPERFEAPRARECAPSAAAHSARTPQKLARRRAARRAPRSSADRRPVASACAASQRPRAVRRRRAARGACRPGPRSGTSPTTRMSGSMTTNAGRAGDRKREGLLPLGRRAPRAARLARPLGDVEIERELEGAPARRRSSAAPASSRPSGSPCPTQLDRRARGARACRPTARRSAPRLRPLTSSSARMQVARLDDAAARAA